MKRKTWPLVVGVILVGALAGVALGGRPSTLPAVQIPPSTTSVATKQSPAETTVAPTAPPTTAALTTAASTSAAPAGTSTSSTGG